MADSTLQDLTPASAVQATDAFYADDGVNDVIVTAAQIKVFNSASPTLVTPALGTPSAGNLVNCTGYTLANVAGFGSNVATFLATPSVANLAAALTDEPFSATIGGTANAFFAVAGPASSIKTYTFPNSSETIAALTLASQTLVGGANVTALTQTAGNITVNPGLRPLQYQTNSGAFTLTAPAADGSMVLLSTNDGSAGTITFSGFSVSATPGDALTTTNTHKFSIHIWRINGVSGYRVAAHQ